MTKEGFPVTALREISVLLSLSHECVVSVREMVVGTSFDKVFMVMEVSDECGCVCDRFLSHLIGYVLVYGNGLEGGHEDYWLRTLSSIGTKVNVASDTIGDESYSSKVAIASRPKDEQHFGTSVRKDCSV
jgi:hypothetical protein